MNDMSHLLTFSQEITVSDVEYEGVSNIKFFSKLTEERTKV